MKQEEQARNMQKIIAKAWMDDGFKARLISEPRVTLQAEGQELPPGVEIRVVADTETVQHLVLPVRPSDLSMTDAELAQASGGGGGFWCSKPGE
ncbi:MAG TPA: NHLP leader peptide family RiPP precursor [Terriglobia bacterium]|nr:NHLP leader peptide family RiPP precursor [Terriglobia bacterium]